MADAGDELLAQLLTQILTRLTAVEAAQIAVRDEVIARLEAMEAEVLRTIRQDKR